MELPKKVQDQIVQYQQLEQQLESIMIQKSQIAGQNAEVKAALDVLEKADADAVVYESAGSILVQREGRDKMIGELNERLEMLDVRMGSIEKQEASLKERFTTLQKDITNAIQGAGPG